MSTMTAKPNLDRALARWEEALHQMEVAILAADWDIAHRMMPGVGSQFDRLRALLEAPPPPARTAMRQSRDQRLLQGAMVLERLLGLLHARQDETKLQIQARRRARRATRAYKGTAPVGPQHLRIIATKPPEGPDALARPRSVEC